VPVNRTSDFCICRLPERVSSRPFGCFGTWVFLLGLWVFGSLGLCSEASPFDDQVAAFEQAGNQSEAMVTALLKTAIDEHREAEGMAAVRAWLSANTSSSQALLFYAGKALQHSGEWSDALVFYRKVLTDPSINPKLAAIVVPQAYRLLIDDMRDTESAYLFMREEGIRLRQYGRASQFDHWFMREAQRRNDFRALAERLTVIHANPKENPATVAEFMEPLLTRLEQFEPLPDATGEALDNLVAVARNEPRLKARWDWNKAVVRYDQERAKAGKASQEQLDALLVETHPAARALLAVEPLEGANLIVKAWSRFGNSDTRKFYGHLHAQRDIKVQPFLEALPRLPPEQGKALLKAGPSRRDRRGVSVASFISPETAWSLVPRAPAVFNALDAPGVELWDKDLTVETARELAPHLLRNPQGHAALIRAMAATGSREMVPLLDAIMKSESWRFADAASMIKMVWDSGLDRADLKQDKLRDKVKDAFNKQQATIKKPTAPEAGLPPQTPAGPSAQADPSATDPAVVSRELLALPENASPQAVETALKAVLQRVSQAPEPVAVLGLQQVAASPEWTGNTRKLVMSLFGQRSPLGGYPRGQYYGRLAERLLEDAQKSEAWGELIPYVSALWRAIDDDKGRAETVIAFADAAQAAGRPSVALAVSRIGLRGKFASVNPNDARYGGQARVEALRALAGSASVKIGLVEIPVDADDPAYAIFQSNAAFLQGNAEGAWKLYRENSELLMPAPDKQAGPSLLRKLSVDYAVWLLKRTIEDNRTDAAESLFRELTQWAREESGLLSLQQDAELKMAYADIALRRGALPAARAWYRQVADAREFEGSEMQLRAALGSVTIDRMSRDFGAALQELDNLLRKKIPGSTTRLHFARAEVLMEQESYKEAMDEIDDVLRREPAHEDAMILRGQIQIQMRRLVEASEVEIGITRANKVMVPGEVLKINLLDPTLSVSGVGSDIEVDVWTKSGDRERLMLHPLGDDAERFRAEISTTLGPPVPDDKTLQVLGEDEIRFGYSKRFRDKMKKLPPDPDTVITIASDAQLAFSAGAFTPRQGESKISIEEMDLSSAQRKLGTRTVRPGNPVYLRVIDPDQSKTDKRDELPVRLEVSSGDVIRRFMLKETGPYTGEFTGVIPTAGAQAMAFASESATGRDPNMSISAEAYPGWLGNAGDKAKARTFGVDFNDNVPLDTMTMPWVSDEAALTHFVLQTSLNGRDWETRARYPDKAAPWDGHPRVSSFPVGRDGIEVSNPTGKSLPPDWEEHMTITSIRPSCKYLAATVPGLSAGKLPLVEGPGNQTVLMQVRALFYQPDLATRRFHLTGAAPESTIFLIDGQPSDDDPQEPLMIAREFKPGLHEIQVWRRGTRDALLNSSPVLLDAAGDSDTWQPCPDGMFDPATFPAGVQAQLPQPAGITNVAGGVTITFGDKTQARIVRLLIHGFQGIAPSIGKLTVQGRDGKAYLPVAQDFMALRDNAQLEVLPGDQLVARYEDAVPATPGRTRHEGRLGVAFNTATISASFLTYSTSASGRQLQLGAIRRFNLDDAIAVVIDDVDMDRSPEHDLIDFVAVTSDGAKTKLQAMETEPHSGQFIGRVFPVEGRSQRDSELQVSEGATLTFIYRDKENLDPGIPADRRVTIEHAKYMTPEFGVYTTKTEPLLDTYVRAVASLPVHEADAEKNRGAKPQPKEAALQPRRTLSYHFVDESGLATTPLKALIGGSVSFNVVASHLALAGSSKINAYVQTDAGRRMAAEDPERKDTASDMPFDITVPGTLKLTGGLGGGDSRTPPGYAGGKGSGSIKGGGAALDEGRFSFSVPLVLGDCPVISLATKDADSSSRGRGAGSLVVHDGDTVYIGFAWMDENERVQWKTASLKVESHAFLDVVDERYSAQLDRVFVGEKVFVQLLAPGLSRDAEREWVTVNLSTSSGAAAPLRLRETGPYTGLFRGGFDITYAGENLPVTLPAVERKGFPVRYGDEVVVRYRTHDDDPEQLAMVAINMGADGSIEPFSKRFTDDEMAVKTTFTLAECFFELAKHHRKMDQESLSRREMAHAKKLLQESMNTHRSDDLQAHAEYLLANLTQEYADLTQNDQDKIPGYREALARFIKIPTDYPDTAFANKSQFKIGLIYEKLGEGEIAVEEYVKLAYKFPKSEHIPEVMARLGKYFQATGQAIKEQADPLREKDDVESKAEVLRLDERSFPEFIKAATIYDKLQERFPDHKLAGIAGLGSAQNLMRAQQYDKAIDGFRSVVVKESYDDGDIRAQALFWSGLCHERMPPKNRRDDPLGEAYRVYRRVTYDFPDSKWAKYARGRLADPAFAKTVEADEGRRQGLLKALEAQKRMGKDSAQKRTIDKLLKR
jgi:outer membrane protein assembly factor BamD (BamD/ComL family)